MPPKRGFCFTLNNYNDESLANIRATLSGECVYGIVGREVGESGTPHLQGYCVFRRALRLPAIKDKLDPRVHLEIARGSPEANRRYCSKDGKFDEYGELPRLSARSGAGGEACRDEVARDLLSCVGGSGLSTGLVEFAERRPGSYYFSGHALLRNYLSLQRPVRRDSIGVDWYWGEPGTGKSREAHDMLPGAYVKDPKTKWWNGYLLEETVIIDDYGIQCVDINHLLRWFDRYPCMVENKGGMLPLFATKFVVTSNFHPSQLFKAVVYKFCNSVSSSGEEEHPQLPALMRRIKLKEFK